jgi:hypothetical protein
LRKSEDHWWARLIGPDFLTAQASPALVICLIAFLLTIFLRAADSSYLVDHFYARRAERSVLKVWMRQAVNVSYEECKRYPDRCIGQIVVWPEGNSGMPIYWLNGQQVPRVVGKDARPFTAVGIVRRVLPDAIEMVFLGSPDGSVSGTTTGGDFGLLRRKREPGQQN